MKHKNIKFKIKLIRHAYPGLYEKLLDSNRTYYDKNNFSLSDIKNAIEDMFYNKKK